ncbi:helix-turn-helix domain-containing protein [Actinotalea ferrariae]|uniref:helix-turn-helix transcriptional regulator n=1 Tax=Actinotalea ferrariae TaxID=1386098 RepID=UPI001C8B9EF7|nr:helix-turn-helix domain-containing protein [Actinotalea ferrariae]MBX9243427.1 helix-turn-helix domain-containing protein [Actinotalea ferrariae]
MTARLLTLDETSARTRVPVASLRWYRARGEGGPKSFKVGRRVMYREDDVEAWLEEQYQASDTRDAS